MKVNTPRKVEHALNRSADLGGNVNHWHGRADLTKTERLASRDIDRGQRLNESREFINKMSDPAAAGFSSSG
jgi:hypothetical protein